MDLYVGVRDDSLVAPFTGAWIEIPIRAASPGRLRVAPFTGAWIEISQVIDWMPEVEVAPFTGAWIEMAEISLLSDYPMTVAPFTGAWIEIVMLLPPLLRLLSHPSRVRGLKSQCGYLLYNLCESHPSRVRGLKFRPHHRGGAPHAVAPFTGAWIEIYHHPIRY